MSCRQGTSIAAFQSALWPDIAAPSAPVKALHFGNHQANPFSTSKENPRPCVRHLCRPGADVAKAPRRGAYVTLKPQALVELSTVDVDISLFPPIGGVEIEQHLFNMSGLSDFPGAARDVAPTARCCRPRPGQTEIHCSQATSNIGLCDISARHLFSHDIDHCLTSCSLASMLGMLPALLSLSNRQSDRTAILGHVICFWQRPAFVGARIGATA